MLVASAIYVYKLNLSSASELIGVWGECSSKNDCIFSVFFSGVERFFRFSCDAQMSRPNNSPGDHQISTVRKSQQNSGGKILLETSNLGFQVILNLIRLLEHHVHAKLRVYWLQSSHGVPPTIHHNNQVPKNITRNLP